MQKKVALIFGGKSPEHDIAVWSFKLIYRHIDKKKFSIRCIYIDKEGFWSLAMLDGSTVGEKKHPLQAGSFLEDIDVVFPIIHGVQGEDGTLQGFLDVVQVPYVGSGVLGSSICWDKDVCKRLLQQNKLPVGPYIAIEKEISYEKAKKALGKTIMVKPSGSGSSLGMNKVDNAKDFYQALECAFIYDKKILLEKFIYGREFCCSVLGNRDFEVSLPGEEIVVGHAFYSYVAKYEDTDGAYLQVPAKLSKKQIKIMQDFSKRAATILECRGMARVDFFLDEQDAIYLNEVNTIPGFTDRSLYHKLWENSGLDFTSLITKLIELETQEVQKSPCYASRCS